MKNKFLLFWVFILISVDIFAQECNVKSLIVNQLDGYQKRSVFQADSIKLLGDEFFCKAYKEDSLANLYFDKLKDCLLKDSKKLLKEAQTIRKEAKTNYYSAYNNYFNSDKILFKVYSRFIKQNDSLNNLDATINFVSQANIAFDDANRFYDLILDFEDINKKYELVFDAYKKIELADSLLLTAYSNYIIDLQQQKDNQLREQILRQSRQSDRIVYKIQFAASHTALSLQELRRIFPSDEVILGEYDDDIYKYSIGFYSSFEQANSAKEAMGIKGAFVVAYKNGKRMKNLIK